MTKENPLKRILLLVVALLLVQLQICAQQVENATMAPGEKATLYIVRISNAGALINFKYFIDGRYIGKFNHGKYMKLGLEPGNHLIFAKAENISYLEADLEKGKTYILDAQPRLGGFKSAVRLRPVTENDEKLFLRALKNIKKKREISFTAEELAKDEEKVKAISKDASNKYHIRKEEGEEFPVLNVPVTRITD